MGGSKGGSGGNTYESDSEARRRLNFFELRSWFSVGRWSEKRRRRILEACRDNYADLLEFVFCVEIYVLYINYI